MDTVQELTPRQRVPAIPHREAFESKLSGALDALKESIVQEREAWVEKLHVPVIISRFH